MKEIPLYLFTGFLEGGKTHFIQETMEDSNFNEGVPTLLLMCEEGEEEYDVFQFPNEGKNITLSTFDKEDRLTPDRLEALRKRANAEMVVVEYNGMWNIDSLYNNLPPHWVVAQEIFIADATTIMQYNANMRQLVVDKLNSSQVVVFNRVSESTDQMALHKLVRGISRRAKIAYETVDGDLSFDDIEDPLPFDVNAKEIIIEDKDYAIFYRDISEETEKYDGKTISFKAVIARQEGMDKDQLALGRHVMFCCADDIAYRAFDSRYKDASQFKSYDWASVTAKVKIEKSRFYGTKGPVLYVTKMEKAEKPDPELATFY